MKRVFDDDILEGLQKDYDLSIQELEEMKASFENWYNNDAQINSREHAGTENFHAIIIDYFDKHIKLRNHDKSELERTYKEVWEAENRCVYKLQETGLKIRLFNNSLQAINNALGPAGNDDPAACYTWEEVAKNLKTLNSQLADVNVATLYDYHSKTGRWREVLQRTGPLSDIEYRMLSLIWADLETIEEIEEYCRLLCTKTGPDGQYEHSTRWDIDRYRLANIQKCVSDDIETLRNLHTSVSAMTPDAFRTWYQYMYGETISINETEGAKTRCLEELLESRWALQQKQTLMLGMENLENFSKDPKYYQTLPPQLLGMGEETEWRLFVQGHGALGPSNDFPLDITRDAGKSAIELAWQYNCHKQDRFRGLGTIVVDSTMPSVGAPDVYRDIDRAYMAGVFQIDDSLINAEKVNSAKNAVVGIGSRKIGSILKEAPASILKKAGGNIVPFIGPVVSGVYGMNKTNYDNGLRMIEMKNMDSLIGQVGLAVKFGLDVNKVYVKDAPDKSLIVLYAGTDTDMLIQNYNTWVTWKTGLAEKVRNGDIQLSDSQRDRLQKDEYEIRGVGKGGQITMEDIYAHPEAISKMWQDKTMSGTEMEKVFGREPVTERMLNETFNQSGPSKPGNSQLVLNQGGSEQ